MPNVRRSAKNEGHRDGHAEGVANGAQEAQRIKDDAQRVAEEYAARIRRIGNKQLDAIDEEYERVQQLTPIFDATSTLH